MIEVFPAISAHSEVIAEIHAASVDEPWGAIAIGELLQNQSVSAAIVAIDGVPAGFMLIQQASDEAEILNIATLPASRQKGLAKSMILSVSKQLARGGVRALFLEVAEDNAAARGLYRALGFSQVGRRPAYYARGDVAVDALLLRLDLVEGGTNTR